MPVRRYAFSLLIMLVGAAWVIHAPPAERTRRVRFTVHEGSWLGFDVSPDGSQVVMDLLGQLWILPTRGGVAHPITDAVRDSAEYLDPVFAPDGRSVLAHGEFRGQAAIVATGVGDRVTSIMAPDFPFGGTGLVLHSPSWSGDGSHILLVRPDSTGTFALIEKQVTSGVERVIPVTGLGPGVLEGPVYSRDGSAIYFSAFPKDEGTFPAAGRIWRVAEPGGAARPFTPARMKARAAAPSPDGKSVAYLVTDSSNAVQVWVQGVRDSVGVQLTDEAEVTPTRVRWLPGSDAIVYGARGRLWRLDVATRTRREIPFSATIDFQRREAALAPIRFPAPGEERTAMGASGYALSPDGRSIAIIALSRLWIAPAVAGARAHEIVGVPAQSSSPEWSPDGRHIVWWAGPIWEEHLFVADTVTRTTRRLIDIPGFERNVTWSPDGRRIAFASATADSSGRLVARLRTADVADTVVTTPDATQDLGPLGSPWPQDPPQWSPRGDAVLMVKNQGGRERGATLRFLDGSAPRPIHGIPFDATSIRWLPGDTLAFIRDFRIWKAFIDVTTGRLGDGQPVAADAADGLAASPSGSLLFLGAGGLRLLTPEGEVVAVGRPVHYTVPEQAPLVVRNVRIIDGTGTPPSGPRDIFVQAGRITRIEAAGTLRAPPGATVLEGGGRVAIPGLIDLHSHHATAAALRGQLYYGVTAMRRLGGGAQGFADNVASGAWLGPRLVEAAMFVLTDEPPLWPDWRTGAPGDEDLERLGRALTLATDATSAGLVKIHSGFGFATMDRTVELAHERGTRVTGHCAYPLTLVAAGIDSKEHLGWQCTVHDGGVWYDDLVQLYARSGVAVVTTRALFSNTHRLRGAPEPPPAEVAGLYGATELNAVSRSLNWLSRLTPGNAADLRNQTDAIRKLRKAGVLLGAGTDFERPDGIQYEMEALVEASLTPLEAIAAATSHAARILGATDEIGRIAPGLLADIVLLDADPTADIRNSRRVWAVVQGGRIVDRPSLMRPGWDTVDSREAR